MSIGLQNVSKEYLMLNPVNATSGGIYSSKGGLPLIKFDISSSDAPMLLDGSQLRISGKITCKTGADGAITNTENHFNDGFCGRFSNLVDMVTISSKRLNQVVERVNNYSRIVPSVVSSLHNGNDIHTGLYHEGDHLETPILARHLVAAGSGNNQGGKTFSAPLYCGVLQSGKDMDLSKNGMGGLVIEILLKPDVNVIFGSDAATANDSFQISDLVLTCPVYRVKGAGAQAGQVSQFEFNSLSSIFQVINSSTSVVALTPGFSRVSSIFMNFINTNEIGNQNFNSCRLGNIGEVRELRFSKNGQLYPISFRLETDEQNNAVLSNNNTYRARCMIDRNYMESVAIKRYADTNKSGLAWNSWASGVVNRSQTAGNDGVTPGTAEGFGILYDAYGSGEDFSQVVFSFELEASSAALDGSATNAQGVYMVFLNKNTINMSADGISIQR